MWRYIQGTYSGYNFSIDIYDISINRRKYRETLHILTYSIFNLNAYLYPVGLNVLIYG